MLSVLRHKQFLAALATALLWWLAMQKLGLFAFGWIAFVPLLLAAGEISAARARFFYGWAAGALCFALHNWWLLPTITKASVIVGVPNAGGALLGVLSVALIAAGHGLGGAVLTALWNPLAPFFRRAPLLLPFLAALWWLVFEWLRGSGELAHSWGAPAFSQWSDAALLQSASVLGQHGLSALCVWFAANIALWLRPEYSAHAPNLWRVPVAVFAVLHFWGAWQIAEYDRAPREILRVLVAATNVSSLHKNYGGESHLAAAERVTREFFETKNRVTESEHLPPDLVVWPETSIAIGDVREGAEQQRAVEVLSRELNVPFLVGAQSFGRAGVLSGAELTNAAVLFSPDGSTQRSGKMRVVPFGERAPFEKILPLLSNLAPRPPVTAATQISPLRLRTQAGRSVQIGSLICFESCFSRPAKTLAEQGAGVLFVLTNDEWFAGTSAPWEHAAMIAVRAAESKVPVVQSANGGYSLGADARGRFVSPLESGSSRVLEIEIPLSDKLSNKS